MNDMRVLLAAFARVWELRESVTSYDGWYVAVAELLDAPLATLDGRLANSSGPHCQFLLPPAQTREPLRDPGLQALVGEQLREGLVGGAEEGPVRA